MGIFDKSDSSPDRYDHDKDVSVPPYAGPEDEFDVGESENADNLHRRLGNRQIQLIAIGGSIGTALFGTSDIGLCFFAEAADV